MAKRIMVKPAAGFKVIKLDGDFLKDSGEEVASGAYWSRRIKFGEVELVADRKPVAKKPAKKAEPKNCLLYTSPSPRDQRGSRMPSSA